MKQLKKAINAIAKANPNGFTVGLETLNKVKSGIVVAYYETQDSFDNNGLENVLKHAKKHSQTVGGWLNDENGKYYFDSCKIFNNLDEAIAFGKQNKQIAIFDIGNIKQIKL